jgi:aerobic carbon-monoxide dehydrogenase medium subunit
MKYGIPSLRITLRGSGRQVPKEQPVKPASFAYHRASSAEHAVALLAERGDEAKILAGGLSLVPMMNFRLARPTDLIDITRVPGLSYLRPGPDSLRVGALTPHRTVEICRDPVVLGQFGVLVRAVRWIGHYPIRVRGTVGGSLAHADPASEWCLLAVLLDARIVLLGPDGQRVVRAREFFHGFLTTAAEPDEMVVEVRFPPPAGQAAFTEFAPRQGDFAIVAAGAVVTVENGRCQMADVVLGGVGSAPVRVGMDAISGQPASEETWQAAGALAAEQIDPPADLDGDAAYRKNLAAALVARVLAEASKQ